MKIMKRHLIDEDESRERLEILLNYWNGLYGTRFAWNKNNAVYVSGKLKGVTIDGTFILEHNHLNADFSFGPTAEKMGIPGYLNREINEFFSLNNSLEALRNRR